MDLQIAEAFVRAEMRRYPACLGWLFKWNRRRTASGVTIHSKRTLGISKPYAQRASAADFIDTVRHEIAHILAGPEGALEDGGGHGPRWVSACRITGAVPDPVGCAPSAGLGPYWVGYCDCELKSWPWRIVRRRTTPPSPNAWCGRCGVRVAWQDLARSA